MQASLEVGFGSGIRSKARDIMVGLLRHREYMMKKRKRKVEIKQETTFLSSK